MEVSLVVGTGLPEVILFWCCFGVVSVLHNDVIAQTHDNAMWLHKKKEKVIWADCHTIASYHFQFKSFAKLNNPTTPTGLSIPDRSLAC